VRADALVTKCNRGAPVDTTTTDRSPGGPVIQNNFRCVSRHFIEECRD
jgi:hypothetical protein